MQEEEVWKILNEGEVIFLTDDQVQMWEFQLLFYGMFKNTFLVQMVTFRVSTLSSLPEEAHPVLKLRQIVGRNFEK